MRILERILVALDFDETFQPVLDQAIGLASAFEAELVPVHALEQLGEREAATARMADAVAMANAKKVRCHAPIVQHGRPFSVVLTAANTLDVNLIVLGASEKSLAERLLAGITANKVMHQATMPVWVAHPAGQSAAIRHILAAVDFSPASDQALTTAIHLARNLNASLQVLHVAADGDLPADRVLAAFDEYLTHFDLGALDHSRSLRQGQVCDEILQAALDSEASLIVMGAFGNGSLIGQFLGNNADKVMRSAPCSVLTVKHRDIFKIVHEQATPRNAREAMASQWVEANLNELADYIEEHYQAGREMLAKGFLEDAIVEFRLCLDRDNLFTQAYEGIAEAYARMGRHRKAGHYLELARDHRRILWQQKVQADVRRQHSLFSPGVDRSAT